MAEKHAGKLNPSIEARKEVVYLVLENNMTSKLSVLLVLTNDNIILSLA